MRLLFIGFGRQNVRWIRGTIFLLREFGRSSFTASRAVLPLLVHHLGTRFHKATDGGDHV